jgi:metallo-beta-lactamase class B
MPQLARTRRIWLYLPPDYASSTKRYPVIYMHDGQNLFDAATAYAGEWGIDETLDSLHAAGDRGAIVVGIDNGGTKRMDEYSPWKNERYGGGEGAAYVAFIVETLKPWIDAHYRTLPDRLSTAIAGSSMGGLISLYAILEYPHVFGRAGVFSPSLWFSPHIFGLAKASQPLRPDPRIYLVTGGLEIAQGERAGIYADDQTRLLDALTAVGFKTSTEVTASTPPDGQHAEWFWRREFPTAYRWLFETR